MPRRALLVGINTYGGTGDNDLHACAADARALEHALSRHKDGRKNFDCITWADRTSDNGHITRPSLRAALLELFRFDGDVLLHFSGHGFLSETGGLLCTSDGIQDDWGIPMQEVVDLAVKSQAHQILLILDCCHSGNFGNPSALSAVAGKNPLSTIRENMTVIAASHATEAAVEAGGHGLFTSALLDGLEGGAADHMGFVTAPALYMYARRRFTAWDQRPVFKTNASDVLCVRECEPLIDRLQLRQLNTIFPTADHKYPLDPEYEPEDEFGNVKEPIDTEKVAIAKLFKSYRDAGLVRSSNPALQFYWVARQSGTVELTARGREYWWLLVNDKI
ncbi:MAG: caspase family protein [Chromatiales bacterium]|nr:caspase family protein [Chromatiales bacterium]